VKREGVGQQRIDQVKRDEEQMDQATKTEEKE